MRSDESRNERLVGLSYFLEYFETVGEMVVVCLVDLVFATAVFHLTDGDGLVGTVYQQVDLCAMFQVFIGIFIFYNFSGGAIGP